MKKNTEYWIYGKHAVVAAIKNKKRVIKQLLVTKQSLDFLQQCGIMPQEYGIKCSVDNRESISLKVGSDACQGIAVQTIPLVQPNIKEFLELSSDLKHSTIVILDQVSDPQNIGAIIRTSVAFGARAMIVPEDHSPKETNSMVKAAVGAFESLPFISVTNLNNTIKLLKKHEYWAIGMSHNADQKLEKEELSFKKTALVLGSEEYGIRNLVEKNCDLLLRIHMREGSMESINVSSAAAIALHSLSTCNT